MYDLNTYIHLSACNPVKENENCKVLINYNTKSFVFSMRRLSVLFF